MKKRKQNYYVQFYKYNWNNLRNKWRGTRSLIAIKHSSTSNMHMLWLKSPSVTDSLHIANIFDDYFSSVSEQIKSISNFWINHFKIFLINPKNSRPAADAHEVNLTSSQNSEKSTGPDSLLTKVLKLLKKEISTHRADIFNLSFPSGVFPSILKIVNAIPVQKKESKLAFLNSRPITLLSNIDKIIEKIIHKRICKCLDKNSIIFSLHFGFRQCCSTLHALVSLAEAIMKALDSGNFSCGLFVNLQKASDSVDYSVLFIKLCHYRIHGLANKWFESYLADRNQVASIIVLHQVFRVVCHNYLFCGSYFFCYTLITFV